MDQDAEDAWREEIARRLQEIDSETAKLVPWDEARRRLRMIDNDPTAAPQDSQIFQNISLKSIRVSSGYCVM